MPGALTPRTSPPESAGVMLAGGRPASGDQLSPVPILDAVERYRGTIVDLDASRLVGPDEFATARAALIVKLRREGLHPGDRVLVALPNGPLFVAAFAAILACEGSPLLVHAKTPPAELQRYAQRFGVRFLACEPTDDRALAEIEVAATAISLGNISELHWGTLFATDWACQGPLLRGVPLHPTSGSTGLPKIALRPGFAALEEARHYAETMSIGAEDWIVAVPPMSHAYGYGMCLMVPLLTGANIISLKRFSVKLLAQASSEQAASILPTVPAMLDVLSFGDGLDLRSLRWVLAAGATLPRKSAEEFRRKTGAVACPLYGTTETGGISVATAADGQDIDGRVGAPMAGVSVAVRPVADAAELGPDMGRVCIRSSSMMTGYLDDQGVITQPQTDGWFETGDLGLTAADGRIHLRGRDSEVINVSGLKVVPCEVEEAVVHLPGVREIKVYAGEHRSGTQIVKAALAVEGGLSAHDVRTFCERHLVYYKRPQVITIVESLPRTPTGKIINDRLP